MSEDQAKNVTEALDLLHGEPAAIIEEPRAQKVLRDGIGEEWTVAWVKMSTAFKPHIKELHGAPLAVWLYIALSVNKQGISYPSINKLAEDTGYSRNTVMDAIEKLEEKGYLKVRRGEKRYNLYEPEFSAIGKNNAPTDESKKCTSPVLPTDESSFCPDESSGLDLNKRNKREQEPSPSIKKGDAVDMLIDYQIKPAGIRKAFADFFKLTPNWEAKYNRQFMEWSVETGMTPEQVRLAADVWRSDKRFNWSVPTLKGIQEHWYELIEGENTEKTRLL